MSTAPREVQILAVRCRKRGRWCLGLFLRYANENLSPEEALRKFRQELVISSGKDFIPYTYHFPVAIVIAKIRPDFSLIEIVSHDQPQHRPHVMTRHFWTGWEGYQRPTWSRLMAAALIYL